MKISSPKSKEFFTVCSLVLSGDKIKFACLASKYVGALKADKIGWNLGVLLTAIWCTLKLPYKLLREVTTGQILRIFPYTFYAVFVLIFKYVEMIF